MLKHLVIAAALSWAALAGFAGQAHAQVNCTQIGNNTFCNGPSGSVNCTRIGNNTFCN
jgi:hypothetical protein